MKITAMIAAGTFFGNLAYVSLLSIGTTYMSTGHFVPWWWFLTGELLHRVMGS